MVDDEALGGSGKGARHRRQSLPPCGMKTNIGVFVGLVLMVAGIGEAQADEENILFPNAIELTSSDGRTIKAHVIRFNEGGVEIEKADRTYHALAWKSFDKGTAAILQSMRKKNIAGIKAKEDKEEARVKAEKDAEDARRKLEILYDNVDDLYLIKPESWTEMDCFPLISLSKGQEPKVFIVALAKNLISIESVTVFAKGKGKGQEFRANLKLDKDLGLARDDRGVVGGGVVEIRCAQIDEAMHDALWAAADPESSGTIRIRGRNASNDFAINKKFKHACRDIIALQREILKTKGWFEAHKKNKGLFDDAK